MASSYVNIKIRHYSGSQGCNACRYDLGQYKQATYRIDAQLRTDGRKVHAFACDEHVDRWQDATVEQDRND